MLAPSVPAEPAPLEEEPKVVQRPSGCRLTWQGKTLINADACDDQSASQFGHVRTVRTSHTNFYFYAEMPIPLRDFVHVGAKAEQ
jgi:hypothetical protein